jgi:pimeloyl-ACP methyl ester carboxylesterase
MNRAARPPAEIIFQRLAAAARNLRVPTLLVRGRMSELVSEAAAREFLELVPHARSVDVSGAGHMVAGDRNDVFSDAVIGFLSELAPVLREVG